MAGWPPAETVLGRSREAATKSSRGREKPPGTERETMNFFEQELRKLMKFGIAPESAKTSYIGRACYLTLSEGRRARVEYKTCGTADHFAALLITILATNQGAIDSSLLRFEDYFAKQDNGCGSKLAPHIWICQGEPSWYRSPTAAEMKALAGAAK